MNKLFLLAGFVFLTLTGCTFHSSQLDAARAAFDQPEVLPEHYWLLELRGEKILLVAVVETPPRTSYVNPQGISINHDGRDITFVSEWPESNEEVRISREGNILTYILSGEEVISVRCSEWTLVTQLRWQLDCRSIDGPAWSFENEVEINEEGRIVHMHYALWPGLSPIDLIWFPASGENISILDKTAQ